jgi:hypothetical protein
LSTRRRNFNSSLNDVDESFELTEIGRVRISVWRFVFRETARTFSFFLDFFERSNLLNDLQLAGRSAERGLDSLLSVAEGVDLDDDGRIEKSFPSN